VSELTRLEDSDIGIAQLIASDGATASDAFSGVIERTVLIVPGFNVLADLQRSPLPVSSKRCTGSTVQIRTCDAPMTA
jgi:hypothetical protein